MFLYILSRDFREIYALRSGSIAFCKLEEVANIRLSTNENCLQQLQFDFNAIGAHLFRNLVDLERPVVLPPSFRGHTHDSSKLQRRFLFGATHTFYETPEDNLLLMFADIFLELEKFDSDDKWLYGFCAKTYQQYRDFLESKR